MIFSWPSDNVVQYTLVMLGSGSEPQLPVTHVITGVNNPSSTVYCVVSFFWILCFVFSHSIMSTKCPSVSPVSGEIKKRKAITLETKLKIIAQHEGGKPVMTIACELGLSQSTISTILKDKKRISDAAKSSASVKSTVITKKRAGPIDDMEKLLVMWMEDQVQKRIPLSLLMIQAKARSLFNMLKDRANDPTYT